MPQITRKLEFDAGHRVLGHESKCAHLHGHRYVAEVTVSAFGLDNVSRVIDFSKVKELVGGWLDEHWDHNMLLHENDPLLACTAALHDSGREDMLAEFNYLNIFGYGKLPYVVPNEENPTAEVMARLLFDNACELLRTHNITVEGVRLYETPNCWADHRRDGN